MFKIKENRRYITNNISVSICAVQSGLLEHLSLQRRGRYINLNLLQTLDVLITNLTKAHEHEFMRTIIIITPVKSYTKVDYEADYESYVMKNLFFFESYFIYP